MKDFFRWCLSLADQVFNRIEGALGGFSLGIVCALALTFSGIIKAWLFTHIESAFVAILIYGVAFALCGGVGFIAGALFPNAFRVILIPFIPIWAIIFGGDQIGPVCISKQKKAEKGSSKLQ